MKTVETPKHATYRRLVYVAAESLSEGEGSSTQLYIPLVINFFMVFLAQTSFQLLQPGLPWHESLFLKQCTVLSGIYSHNYLALRV